MIELEVLGNDPIELEVTMPTGGGGGTVINNQNKTVTPSLATQQITADAGYTGLGTVTVEAMPSGSEGTPTATKGAVSNHSVDVTPSVTNTEGYIAGGTKSGTAVNVSANELVSGTKNITANGTEDVTNYASVNVNVPNSYSASDEGKVVDNGALVSQSSATYTTNDTYDTTLIDEVTVNVSGGGQSLPRLVDYVEITMASTATKANPVTVNLTPIDTDYLILIMIDTIPSPHESYYIALYWASGRILTQSYGTILRPAGTIGTDNNQASYNRTTGVLNLGGQYGYFLSGTKYHVYQFEIGS